MKSKHLLLMLLIAFFAPWAANAQTPLLEEDFDDMSSISTSYSSDGWYTYKASGNNWTLNTNSDYAYSGSKSAMYGYSSSYNADSYLVSKPFSVTANLEELSVSLYECVRSATYAETFEVFFVKASDVTDAASVASATKYMAIASASYTNTSFAEKTGSNDNSELAGQSVRLVVHCTSTKNYWNLYIDDITVTETIASSCEKPDTFEASDVTHNSATLTWSGSSGTYNVEVKGGDWADWTEILHETTFTTKNLEDLTMATDYQARIQSVCTNEPSGWKTTSFSTICGPISIGYKCGFEGPNTVGTGSYKLPTCWSRPDGTNANFPGATNSYGHNNSSYSLYFYGAATGTLQIAVLPEIDGGVNGKRLALYAYNPSTWYDASFVVGYMTDAADASTFVQVGDPISLSAPTSYGSEPYEFDFDNITGNPHYMAIKSTSTSSSSYFYIDDVELKATPTCLRPTMNTTATDIAATTAKVSWTAGSTDQDHWDVYYCTSPYTAPTASTEPSVTNTADNPCTLTGLSPTTSYRVYVRGNCGDGDVSEWSTNYCQFTTTAYCADMQVQASTIDATATAYNAATVTWTAAGGATQWKVQCSTDNTFATVDKEAVVTEAAASFTGLTAETTYHVRIAPLCSENNDYNPWSSNKTFSTPESCPAPVLAAATNPTAHGATLNWTGTSESYDVMAAEVSVSTTFETGFEDGSLPTDFTTTTSYPWTVVENNHSGTYCAKSSNGGVDSSTSDMVLEVTLTTEMTLTFSAKVSSENTYDKAYFSIDGTSQTGLSGISGNGNWKDYSFNLTAATHTLRWYYTKDVSDFSNDDCFYVDDIKISSSSVGSFITVATNVESPYVMDDATIFEPETPYQVKVVGNCPWTNETTGSNIISFTTASSCETPSNLQESEVTANSAKITWDTHGLDEFNLRYSTDGENWTTESNVTCPHTINGLTGNTEYQVQAQATCNTEVWSTSKSFITDCGSISVATEAYTYDFETALKWNCWTNIQGASRTNSSSYAHNSNYLLMFSGNMTNLVALPEFEEELSTLQIKFWTRPEAYNDSRCGTFDIGYLTDIADASTFQSIENYKYNDWTSNTYVQKTVYLDNVPADAIIAFRHNANSTVYYWFVDDVEVSLAPLCRPVKNLASSNVTNHSATITWTGGTEDQDTWEIKYNKENDFNPDEAGTAVTDPITTPTYTFNKALDAASVYYIYVRANCGGSNGNSPWTKIVISTSASAPAPTAFNKKEVGPNWVDLYWNAPAGDLLSGYGIYYSTTNTAPTAETEATVTINNAIAPTTEAPYRLTNLENEETYYLWVRANHETGVYSSWVALSGSSITTLVACPVPTNLTATTANTTADLSWTGSSAILEGDGYTVEYSILTLSDETETTTETFADYTATSYNVAGELPTGWKGYGSSSYNPHVSSNSALGTSYDITGIGGGEGGTDNFLYMIGGGSSPYNSFTILPQFGSLVSVSFDYAYESTSYGTLSVGYCTNNTSGSTYTAFNDLTITKTTTSVNVSLTEADIAAINSNNGYLAFRWNCSSSYGIAIDNVAITSKAYVAGEWQTAVTGFTEGFTYQLTGLNAGSKYNVRVYSGCTETPDTENATTTLTTLPFTKTIAPYSTNGYYLIASPLAGDANGEIAATDVANLIDNETPDNFALYRFNQDNDLEWENWKAEGDHYHFNLESGRGYLYGNTTGVTLTFTGAPYSGNGEVSLTYNTEGAEFAGWNLVGNPFGETAYIDGNVAFYTMKEGGAELEANTSFTSIEPMEGVFVYTEEDGATLTFSTDAPEGNGDALTLNVSKGRSVIDRAIVNFGQGGKLPKFMLNRNSTKVYIPQDGKEYAVVNAESQGEMPVSFKAEENDTYTLSFNSTEVMFNYLHLIDNMTGNDVDLLQTPSYTFNATTTDYSSRFKLVFAVGSSADSETFAFYSNGNWIINNEGEALLQVIDVNGRILSSETVNGSVSKAINTAPGVYMIRLINGDNVRTQKVVVR